MSESSPEYVTGDLRAALDAAGERPAENADRAEKKNYAERLSRALAITVADRLRGRFPEIQPTREGGQETAIGAAGGRKRLDVCVWDPRDGLVLDVSIKTYSFQDYSAGSVGPGRMTKNVVRNDHELRAEAQRIHARQPYAVLVALMFVPTRACDDGTIGPSSFAHMVTTFRERTGRVGHDDLRLDRFEAFYIGLYESEGNARGSVRFFDVTTNPPRNGRPRREHTIGFEELVARVHALVDRRNGKVEDWAEPAADSDPWL